MGKRPICVLCLLLISFLLLGDWMGIPLIRGNPLPESLKRQLEEQSYVSIVGEVETCTDTEFSQSVYLKDVSIVSFADQSSIDQSSICKSEKVSIGNVRVFLKEKEMLPAGSLILVSGILEEVGEPRNPGEFDSRQYYACRHIYYFMKKAVVEKKSSGYSRYRQFLIDLGERLGEGIDKASGEAASVFRAVALGDKGELEEETKIRYQMGGIIHILAISGLHISVLGAGLYEILKRLGLGIWSSGMAALFLMLQYGMMTGGSVSTMRAVTMFLLSIGGRILGRIYDMPTALSVAAILILTDSPAYLLDGGFWLSFGAVIGIGMTAPVLTEAFGAQGKVSKALISSFAVQVTALPILLWFYGEVSVVGIFLNLLVLPTVGIVLGSGVLTALVGLFWENGAFLCALPGRVLLFLYETLCSAAGKIPFCTWVGGKPKEWQIFVFYVILFGALAVWKWRMRGEGCRTASYLLWRGVLVGALASGIWVAGWRQKTGFQITCLDIGQGDAIVVETPQGQNFLIDGGSSNKKKICQYQILPYLKSRGISYIDAVFISHTDKDHISGVQELLEYQAQGLTSVRVGCLVLPKWENPPEEWIQLAAMAEKAGISVRTGMTGDMFQKGEVRFKVLAPQEGTTGEDVNEGSMVMMVSYGAFRGIFTGDAGEKTEKMLLETGVLENVDYLKVGHHGSKYSTCEVFLEEIRPELGVISVSASNTHGHPSLEALERLEQAGVKVVCTKDCGAVTAKVENDGIKVTGYVE